MKTCIVFTIESTCFTRRQQHPGKQKQLNIYWVENIVFVILMLYGLFLWWMWLDTWIWIKWGRKSKSDVSSSGVVATSWPPAQLSSYFSLLVTFVFVTSIVSTPQPSPSQQLCRGCHGQASSLKPFDTTVVTDQWPVAVCLSMSCWKVNTTLIRHYCGVVTISNKFYTSLSSHFRPPSVCVVS